MVNAFDDEATVFVVLVNDEDQYSLWPKFKEIPSGWKQVGPIGNKEECLKFVEANWTDMRPRSLKEARVAASKQ
jgi:MbtH protein